MYILEQKLEGFPSKGLQVFCFCFCSMNVTSVGGYHTFYRQMDLLKDQFINHIHTVPQSSIKGRSKAVPCGSQCPSTARLQVTTSFERKRLDEILSRNGRDFFYKLQPFSLADAKFRLLLTKEAGEILWQGILRDNRAPIACN